MLAFGINLEQRTALRRVPMTDLGVFSCAAWAAGSGDDLYAISDWHGWHYQYPPTLAILFQPLKHPLPLEKPALPPGTAFTEANTPWGYCVDSHQRFYGLHRDNFRFFCIVAAWYFLSVFLAGFSAHALACGLEGAKLGQGPPLEKDSRQAWWALRGMPLLVFAESIGTDFSRGQVDVLMLGAIALALYLASTGRFFTGGFSLSIPAVIKLFPPFILLYPMWRRQWRMTLGVIAGLLFFLGLLPVITFGVKRTGELYGKWVQVLAAPALGRGTDTSRRGELTGMNATDNQSLLACIHNWQYHERARKQRPAEASPAARWATYGAGVLMLLGIGIVSGVRKEDSPTQLYLLAGLLLGLSLVVNPIVHNYYYLLLLPLASGLMHRRFVSTGMATKVWKLPVLLWFFMLTDLATRLPGIGAYLRDWGVPLLSVICLMVAGAIELFNSEVGTAPVRYAKEAVEPELITR